MDENKYECDQESKKVDGGDHGCCGRCIRDWSCNGRDEAAAAHCIPIKPFKIMMRMMAGVEMQGYVPARNQITELLNAPVNMLWLSFSSRGHR